MLDSFIHSCLLIKVNLPIHPEIPNKTKSKVIAMRIKAKINNKE